MFKTVLIVTTTILANVQSSTELGCYLDPAYQQAMIKSGIPYTRCVRIEVTGEADQCPTVHVHLGISSHIEAFCLRWDNEGQQVDYQSPLKIRDTIECQCSVDQKCNGNFPALLQRILDGEPSLTPTDLECIRASVIHQVMVQQNLEKPTVKATITSSKRMTKRTTKKKTASSIKSSRTTTTKSTSPKLKETVSSTKPSPFTTLTKKAPPKLFTTEIKVKKTTILSSSTRTTNSKRLTSASPKVAGTRSLTVPSSDGHVLVTDTSEHSTTAEQEGLVEEVKSKEKEEISKERRRRISLHLLMLSLFLVTLSVSQLFCMCRFREKYLRSPPEKKGKSQSTIETGSPSQSPLPGQASRQTPASSLLSGKESQKSGKKTKDYYDV